MRRRFARTALAVAAVIVLAGLAGGVWAYARLTRSLPVLDGTVAVPGLSRAVTVQRDALGIPTIRAASRQDVARGLGFLHAQDRFFQMDLARRVAAGELSALVGPRALVVDRRVRLHRFRSEAQRAVALMKLADRQLLDAYVAGVNRGLSALGEVPFEYVLLRALPEPWRPEDTLLVVLSMFITLQDNEGAYESTLATMQAVLPPAMFAFMTSGSPDWDSPIAGEPIAPLVVPGPEVYDLRARRAGRLPVETRPGTTATTPFATPPLTNSLTMSLTTSPISALATTAATVLAAGAIQRTATPWLDPGAAAVGDTAIGSNSWAVSGRLGDQGAALLANDMHLTVRVPNTWYRAVLEWSEGEAATRTATKRTLMGLTLPGHPALVVGSNTHVAWGFTNTYADTGDVVLLEIEPGNPNRYRTPAGWRVFDRRDETFAVAGAPDEHAVTTWTIWGPVLPPDARGRARAFRWAAHDADRLAGAITNFESSRTIEEVFDAANGMGVPAQNVVVAGRDGRIGWSIYGALPRREGLDGVLPSSWAVAPRGWNGWLEPQEYPRVVEPASGRIWSANQRMVGGAMLSVLGPSNYEVGSRARPIRDQLQARERFTPADFLAMQLDARASFLVRWRDLLTQTLAASAAPTRPERKVLARLLHEEWSGTAAPESAAYRFTRVFREEVGRRLMAAVLAECVEADATFDYTRLRQREGPIWALLTARPPHLLDPRYASWDAFLLAAADAVIDAALADHPGRPLDGWRWADYNLTVYRHPLSAGLPLVGRWLDMPRRALPGDLYTPRMQWGSDAASERMVVSPGREQDGILHMPTGQSGHPLSPFYANSHEAWATGAPTPFLPGPPLHSLTLAP